MQELAQTAIAAAGDGSLGVVAVGCNERCGRQARASAPDGAVNGGAGAAGAGAGADARAVGARAVGRATAGQECAQRNGLAGVEAQNAAVGIGGSVANA